MNLGVIGYGNRMKWLTDEMRNFDKDFRVTGISDIRNEQIRNELGAEKIAAEHIFFYDNVDEMLARDQFDGICIGTWCSLHARTAIKAMSAGIPLYIEKPVATTLEDLLKLRDAYDQNKPLKDKVVVSFPLRNTSLVQAVKDIIDSGRIGTVEHVQAVNNVHYGGVYFRTWYRDERETGGLFLQKATHDFDYINYVLGLKPVRICAMTSKRVFNGRKPAGLMCRECDERELCLESPYNLDLYGQETPVGEYCSFAADSGNEDSGSALIEYETGMHVTYSQNFFIRNKVGSRGARFMGYKGTVEFDWYTNEVKVFMHHTARAEIYKIEAGEAGHGGGDFVLIRNFIDLVKGNKEKSVSSLDDGLLSALMCLKAKESAQTKTYQNLSWPDVVSEGM